MSHIKGFKQSEKTAQTCSSTQPGSVADGSSGTQRAAFWGKEVPTEWLVDSRQGAEQLAVIGVIGTGGGDLLAKPAPQRELPGNASARTDLVSYRVRRLRKPALRGLSTGVLGVQFELLLSVAVAASKSRSRVIGSAPAQSLPDGFLIQESVLQPSPSKVVPGAAISAKHGVLSSGVGVYGDGRLVSNEGVLCGPLRLKSQPQQVDTEGIARGWFESETANQRMRSEPPGSAAWFSRASAACGACVRWQLVREIGTAAA